MVDTPTSKLQQRVRSYRRGQCEHNLGRNSNRHANNNDTRRGNHNNNRSGNYSTTTQRNNNRFNYHHSSQHRGNNGCSNNGRHNNGRSYDNGNRQTQGQQLDPTTVHRGRDTIYSHDGARRYAAAPPANMWIGNNNSVNPNQRQPSTFRTN